MTAHLLGYLPRELSFYVTCPGEKTAIVKRMLPKPAYFKTHGQSILNEKMEVDQLELIPDVRSVENDLAIIETEIIPEISNFPSVVMDQKELQDVLSLNRCEVLGYSPARCQPSNLSACIQSFTSPFVDGEANGSLAIVARDETKAFLGGDSGAGVICRNQVGEMKLVGVIESDNTAAPAWQLEQFLKNPVQVKVSPETLFAQQRIEQLKSITNVNFRCSRISSKVCGEVSDLLLKASTQIKMLGIKKIIVENKSLIKISREGSVLRISSSVGAKDLDLLFKF